MTLVTPPTTNWSNWWIHYWKGKLFVTNLITCQRFYWILKLVVTDNLPLYYARATWEASKRVHYCCLDTLVSCPYYSPPHVKIVWARDYRHPSKPPPIEGLMRKIVWARDYRHPSKPPPLEGLMRKIVWAQDYRHPSKPPPIEGLMWK